MAAYYSGKEGAVLGELVLKNQAGWGTCVYEGVNMAIGVCIRTL